MCVVFDRATVYEYLFGRARERGMAISEIKKDAVAHFCSLLSKSIKSGFDAGHPCFKYVLYTGFDEPNEVIYRNDRVAFFECDGTVFVNKDFLPECEQVVGAIVSRYNKAYDSETVGNALSDAFDSAVSRGVFGSAANFAVA